MKIQDFKNELRNNLDRRCKEKGWKFDNAKHRGMAFEDWCFELFAERYPAADNDPEECIIRGDDAGIDVVFDSKETNEIYILQCKHPKIANSEPIPENEVKTFFANYELLKDRAYLDNRNTHNSKVQELASGFDYWLKHNFLVNFIFMSTGQATDKTNALVEKYNRLYQNQNVKFEVWDINDIKDEFVEVQSVDEEYPSEVEFTLADGHYLIPEGIMRNITFAVRGTTLQEIAIAHKDSLFNWNIRQFLGKKGEVNSGLAETLHKEPENFFYYNNGISALCEEYSFDGRTRKLTARKLQIVNGAQTLGAIRNAIPAKLKDVLVLVKLTTVKHVSRERGVAAALIQTNNTQNKLRVPDFRSNDKIQQWLEVQFKNMKGRGEMPHIAYGRKRPYPRSSSSSPVLKLQDLGKIRYAWYHDPRIPIADPAKLFVLPEDNGLYGYAFGIGGDVVDMWSQEQFRECLLALHVYNKIQIELKKLQLEQDELKQITRLRYYGLKLFKLYLEQTMPEASEETMEELCRFGAKFNEFFDKPKKIITHTLSQSYREILKRQEGTAFSLPRDAKVWELVRTKFNASLELLRDVA